MPHDVSFLSSDDAGHHVSPNIVCYASPFTPEESRGSHIGTFSLPLSLSLHPGIFPFCSPSSQNYALRIPEAVASLQRFLFVARRAAEKATDQRVLDCVST
ncbi:hypothetical protein TNIN_248781 [Trichonephila inaurata madagascariensis]|uniref:Uncharacterized protein n=1 Tax=Trichonephila inaurata madagascariensis TaxID=2747483 RepID=A0A8X7CPW2_9ARAC|nr:hypothetical protein TNIN_248781 [Trichonephila inaurata madagascariensis]